MYIGDVELDEKLQLVSNPEVVLASVTHAMKEEEVIEDEDEEDEFIEGEEGEATESDTSEKDDESTSEAQSEKES